MNKKKGCTEVDCEIRNFWEKGKKSALKNIQIGENKTCPKRKKFSTTK